MRDFLRANMARVLGISTLILVPCFWHKRLEAGDLPEPYLQCMARATDCATASSGALYRVPVEQHSLRPHVRKARGMGWIRCGGASFGSGVGAALFLGGVCSDQRCEPTSTMVSGAGDSNDYLRVDILFGVHEFLFGAWSWFFCGGADLAGEPPRRLDRSDRSCACWRYLLIRWGSCA